MAASLAKGAGGVWGVLGRAGPLVSALAALPALAVLTTACSGAQAGPGVAQVSSSPSASASHTATGPAAFGACMRSRGISNFPDSGEVDLGSLGIDPNSSQFRSAQKACQPLLGTGAGGHMIPAADQARFLEFSACMRSHGVPGFPDPDFSQGGVVIAGAPGLDPSSPQFQAAQKACAHYLPGGGPHAQRVQSDGGGAP